MAVQRNNETDAEHLQRLMGEWVTGVECSANLVVLHTPPGCAHVVGLAIDRAKVDGVLGTIAGDDTVLVIAAEQPGGQATADQMRILAGLA